MHLCFKLYTSAYPEVMQHSYPRRRVSACRAVACHVTEFSHYTTIPCGFFPQGITARV